MTAEKKEKYLTTNELAARWGYSVRHICRMRADNRGPNYLMMKRSESKYGNRILYRLSDVEDWEKSRIIKVETCEGAANE